MIKRCFTWFSLLYPNLFSPGEDFFIMLREDKFLQKDLEDKLVKNNKKEEFDIFTKMLAIFMPLVPRLFNEENKSAV